MVAAVSATAVQPVPALVQAPAGLSTPPLGFPSFRTVHVEFKLTAIPDSAPDPLAAVLVLAPLVRTALLTPAV